MKKLLFHLSSKKFRKKLKVNNGCISFSLNEFWSRFGNYCYIFDYDTLKKDFRIEKCKNRQKWKYSLSVKDKIHNFHSKKMATEYLVFEDIDLEKYCLGVVKHFNESEGIIETEIIEKVLEKESCCFKTKDLNNTNNMMVPTNRIK
ncbi:MAG: hypothetical protein KAT66_00640 [Candidatus Lokiarchaeota archaeon]|nr:hypothetical protein [Candidatus Lokiarchaeota archaeon]